MAPTKEGKRRDATAHVVTRRGVRNDLIHFEKATRKGLCIGCQCLSSSSSAQVACCPGGGNEYNAAKHLPTGEFDLRHPFGYSAPFPMVTETSEQAPIEFAPYRSLDNAELRRRILGYENDWGSLLILGHHYQQDEVIELSDMRGDSYQLSQMASASQQCRWIVFCGVHFMAETADILANRAEALARRHNQRVTVILPEMAAGCSMADMAAFARSKLPGKIWGK